MKPTSVRRRQRGNQLLELAIITPVILLLAVGMVDMAALYRTHQILNNATREGARFAIQPEHRGKIGDIQLAVVNYFNDKRDAGYSQRALTVADVTIDQSAYIPTESGVFMRTSRITVTYTYTFLYLPHLSTIPAGLTLTTAAQFRDLY
jgi:Flp pilus assembly protein TadG